MISTQYSFEELEPFKGMSVLVSGVADICGQWHPAEPDVGIKSGYWEYDVHAIYIDPVARGGEKFELHAEHVLYKPICEELMAGIHDDEIRELLEEEALGFAINDLLEREI